MKHDGLVFIYPESHKKNKIFASSADLKFIQEKITF